MRLSIECLLHTRWRRLACHKPVAFHTHVHRQGAIIPADLHSKRIPLIPQRPRGERDLNGTHSACKETIPKMLQYFTKKPLFSFINLESQVKKIKEQREYSFALTWTLFGITLLFLLRLAALSAWLIFHKVFFFKWQVGKRVKSSVLCVWRLLWQEYSS